jgi:hypothetical protein
MEMGTEKLGKCGRKGKKEERLWENARVKDIQTEPKKMQKGWVLRKYLRIACKSEDKIFFEGTERFSYNYISPL